LALLSRDNDLLTASLNPKTKCEFGHIRERTHASSIKDAAYSQTRDFGLHNELGAAVAVEFRCSLCERRVTEAQFPLAPGQIVRKRTR
jgi:hypothetical protein